MAPSATLASSETVTFLDSLITRLDAAQTAFSKKQPVLAIQLLDKFVHEVQVHAGRRIDVEIANHLASHAHAIMDSILLMGVKPANSRQQLSTAVSVSTPDVSFDTRQSPRVPADVRL